MSERDHSGLPNAADNDADIDLIDEGARKRFESDWNPRRLGEIESFLPEPADSRYWATLEELLYIDLEFAWKAYEDIPDDETVSVNQSPTIRLKSISDRLKLDQKRDMLQRLWDYEQSLREKSKKRKANDDRTSGVNDAASTATNNSSSSSCLSQDFGNYQLIEPLGRGGMGVVYRAVEKKTGRQVALKMIRSNMVTRVDEETRRIVMDRFQTEARAVANIEHPNIVTLFDVGIHEQTPYLSMQLVKGDDLATRIRQSVLDCKTAARHIRHVALAIDAAHKQGIIHRDIKPHNILLDAERNEPLVTDFGLAKLTDDQQGLTETGELLGTPGYMSPEQAIGKPVDHATDIYSLGATLYCLLGGRPPFQAADTIKTIEQIVNNPPIAPREVNPDVDVDLNTICLKCLEKDPSKRYASSKDLAEDLERYLKGEPIVARPIGPVERSVRWCRRNPLPTTVGVSLVLLIAVAVAAFIISVGYYRDAKNKEANAKDNANIAFKANQKELVLVADDRSLKAPGMRPTRESLLLPLKTFFKEFIDLNPDFSNVKIEYAFAHFALGKILHELDDSETAIDYLARAIKLQTEIQSESPGDERAMLDLSNSLNLRGECLLKLLSPEDSMTDFELAMKWRLKLVELNPASIEYRRKLANIEMNMGNWYAYWGNAEQEVKAIGFYKQSSGTRERFLDSILGTGRPEEFNTRYDQAKCLFNLAASYDNLTQFNSEIEQTEKSLEHAQASMKIFEELYKQRPSDFFVARDKARCAQLLAYIVEDDADSYYVEVADTFLHVAKLYPEEKKYYWLAADAFAYLSDGALKRAALADVDQNLIAKDNEYELARESQANAWNLIKDLKPVTDDQKRCFATVCLGWIPIHLKYSENGEARKKLALAKKMLNELATSKHPDMKTRLKFLNDMVKAYERALGPNL